MGTWGTGPFDDDSAMDWAYGLDEADFSSRRQLIDDALRAAVSCDDYLEQPMAAEAIASAAVVAQLRGGVVPEWSVPRFLVQGGRVEIDEESVALAARALDRVVADGSEWRELWEDAGEFGCRDIDGARSEGAVALKLVAAGSALAGFQLNVPALN